MHCTHACFTDVEVVRHVLYVIMTVTFCLYYLSKVPFIKVRVPPALMFYLVSVLLDG
jgi:hypothetical protein